MMAKLLKDLLESGTRLQRVQKAVQNVHSDFRMRIELIDGRLRAANRGSNGVAFKQRLAMHSKAFDDNLPDTSIKASHSSSTAGQIRRALEECRTSNPCHRGLPP
jgi:hypothetical protein